MNQSVQAVTAETSLQSTIAGGHRRSLSLLPRLRSRDPVHYSPLGVLCGARHADVSFVLRDKRFGKDFAAA